MLNIDNHIKTESEIINRRKAENSIELRRSLCTLNGEHNLAEARIFSSIGSSVPIPTKKTDEENTWAGLMPHFGK